MVSSITHEPTPAYPPTRTPDKQGEGLLAIVHGARWRPPRPNKCHPELVGRDFYDQSGVEPSPRDSAPNTPKQTRRNDLRVPRLRDAGGGFGKRREKYHVLHLKCRSRYRLSPH